VKRVLIIVNAEKEKAASLGARIAGTLEERGWEAVTFPLGPGLPGKFPAGDFAIALSLGGDGTVLHAARALAPGGAPVLAVNLGGRGFLADTPPERWLPAFEAWERGEAHQSRRLMLGYALLRGGAEIADGCCVNDLVISASGIAKLIRLSVDGQGIRPGGYRADGLIFATPTGSTAYSAAAGGPILDPEMEALLLTPICPSSLSNRPLVLPPDEILTVKVEANQRSGVLLNVDGQETRPLEEGDEIRIFRSPFSAFLVATERRSFYNVLRTKLNWTGDIDPGGNHA
jgi:NAD+ kinase